MTFHKVTHVLFDMDGLLIDSETLYMKGFQNVVSRYGKEYTWDTNVVLMGKHTREAAEYLVENLQLPITPDVLIQETQEEFTKLFPTVTLMPGAKRLVEHLSQHNVPIALATSSSIESANLKMRNHKDLFDLFHIKIFGSSDPNVRKGKPDPDIFLVTASQFSDSPKHENCLVFEDAPNGVLSAKAAGMQVVLVPDAKLDRTLTQGPTLLLDSLLDFKPELFGLPPF